MYVHDAADVCTDQGLAVAGCHGDGPARQDLRPRLRRVRDAGGADRSAGAGHRAGGAARRRAAAAAAGDRRQVPGAPDAAGRSAHRDAVGVERARAAARLLPPKNLHDYWDLRIAPELFRAATLAWAR